MTRSLPVTSLSKRAQKALEAIAWSEHSPIRGCFIHTEISLLRQPNCGRKTVDEIIAFMILNNIVDRSEYSFCRRGIKVLPQRISRMIDRLRQGGSE